MSMVQEISDKPGLVHVNAQGLFSLDEAKKLFVEMLEIVAQHKAEKVLIDGRKLTGEPKTMERFYYGEFAAQTVASFATRGVSPATHFAYVLDERMRDPDRFGEVVALNRGMLVKTFDRVEDALKWLRLATAENQGAGSAGA